MKRHGSMNHIYRLVWSRISNGWVAVAENARGRGKGGARKLAAAALSLTVVTFSMPPAHAGPSGGQVVSGTGTIAQSGNTTTITQSTQNLSLNWQSFNIGAQETVNFVQPSASSIAVNRIFDTNGSQILGHLNANGQVFLINPNGIVFGQGAQVNVGGLVASTLDFNDASLLANTRTFSGNGTGSVINQGTLNANSGGYVALLGQHVSNQGTITAQLGTVVLGAGNAVTLTFAGNNLLHLQVDQNVLSSFAENGGLIQADGGMVVMTAGAANSLVASVVNNTGVIEARTVNQSAGNITLLGGMTAGTVNVGGTLDASAPNDGNGGAIETSAAAVNVVDGAKVTTAAAHGLVGSWLLDPIDFTVAASGGNITGAQLNSALANNSVTIDTTGPSTTCAGTTCSANAIPGSHGDINLNDTVNWSSASTLTLNAYNNINVNAPVAWGVSGTPGNTGALVMNAGNSVNVAAQMNSTYSAPLTITTAGNGLATSAAVAGGTLNVVLNPNAGGFAGSVNFYSDAGVTPAAGTGLLSINGNSYIVIADVTPGSGVGVAGDVTSTTLQGMQNNLGGYYAMGSNVDASATGTNAASWNAGAGFSPVSQFNGVFDGLGHVISGFTASTSNNNVGLFGVSTGTVRNVGMVGGSVTGGNNVGELVGNNSGGTVSNSYATGSVVGGIAVGGLVGSNAAIFGQVAESVSSSPIFSTISNSYATGNVSNTPSSSFRGFIGGLVGYGVFSLVSNSYATGSVTGTGLAQDLGGLMGFNRTSTISNSYATGAVTGGCPHGIGPLCGGGGLVGFNTGTIDNSHASGNVSSSGNAGGLAGINNGGIISNSYATGNVFAFSIVGGLVGQNSAGLITNSYATGNITDIADDVGGLAGINFQGATISNSYATGSVTGGWLAGGLVGGSGGAIQNSHATGSVTGSSEVGGLVGDNTGPISNSYATGNVIGVAFNGAHDGSNIGGLAGLDSGVISNSYAIGNATGAGGNVGGLVGLTDNAVAFIGILPIISNSYATGDVSAGTGSNAGGFIGSNNNGTINNSYATGNVIGSSNVGGFAGSNNASTISNSFYNSDSNPTLIGIGNTADVPGSVWGMSTAAMRNSANFSSATGTPSAIDHSGNGGVNPGWDLPGSGTGTTWVMYDGYTMPLLQAFMTPLTVTANNAASTAGAAYSGGNGVAYSSINPNLANLFNANGIALSNGTLTYGGTAQGANGVGTYTIAPILYSNQQGYLLVLNSGTLTVSAETAASRIFDSATIGQLIGGTLISNTTAPGANPFASDIEARFNAPTGNEASNGGVQIINDGVRLPDNLIDMTTGNELRHDQ
jgi:filamentous hemagglutinin family protein